MKKTILSLAMLVIAMTAGAQTIKTAFKKGDVSKYTTHAEYSVGIPMQGEQKGSSDITTTYTVKSVDATGWTVELSADSMIINGNKDIISQFANGAVFSALKKTPALLKLDKKGYITDIVNSDAVLASEAEAVIATINETYAKHPEVEKYLPKATALMKANEQLTKDNLLKFARENTVLALNGQDIKENAPQDDVIFEYFKVKSTFGITKDANGGLTINKKSEGNMTESDIKNVVKKQLENTGATVDDSQMEQVWSQLKSFGMASADLDDQKTYNYTSNGWLTSLTESSNMQITAAKIKVTINTQKVSE